MNPDEIEDPTQGAAAALAKIRAQQAPPADAASALAALRASAPRAQSPAAAAGRLPAIQKAGDDALAGAIADEHTEYPELGGLASFAKSVPGAEAVQAGARSLARGQPYRDALGDIQSVEASTPKPVRVANNLIGGAVAAAALPFSPAKAGAAYGVLNAAGNSNPDASVADRAKDAAIQGTVGAATGKLGETATNAARGFLTPTAGKLAVDAKQAVGTADKAIYGQAEQEAAAGGGTSPAIQQVLSHPKIQPLANDIRESFTLQGKPADDASVLMQAHRELSQNEGALLDRSAAGNARGQARPLTDREQGDVQAVKEMLRSAASDGPGALMPSFRTAVQTHAAGSAEKDAIQEGADAARRVIAGKQPAGKNLATKSTEATIRNVQRVPPELVAQQARGALGTLGSTPVNFNPLKLATGNTASARIAPLMRAFDARSGSTSGALADLLERAGIAAPAQAFQPSVRDLFPSGTP